MVRFTRWLPFHAALLTVAVVCLFANPAWAQSANKSAKDNAEKEDDRRRQANDRAREAMEREAEAQKERARERDREREQMRRQRELDEKRDRERQEAMRQEQQRRDAKAADATRERATQDQQVRRLQDERDRLEEQRRRLERERRLDRDDDRNRGFAQPQAPRAPARNPPAPRLEKPAKLAAAPPEPLSPAELAAVLADLASGDRKRVQNALERLGKAVADGDRAEVARQIAKHLDKTPALERRLASKALEVWATAEQVPQLLELLNDYDKDVRLAAIHALANLKDPRAINPLAERLLVAADRGAAAKALKELGANVEPAVLKHLNHKYMWVRAMTIDVLGAVGGTESAAALKEIAENDESEFVRGKARGAVRAVEDRAS